MYETFTITAKIMNAGAGTAHNVKVELSVDESVDLLSSAVIEIGDLDCGNERTVSWQLEVVSNIGVGFANLKSTSDDAINVTKDILIPTASTFYGDISGDDRVTAYDAALVFQHITQLITLDEEAQKRADVNDNDVIDVNDAKLILRKVVGLIGRFPAEYQ